LSADTKFNAFGGNRTKFDYYQSFYDYYKAAGRLRHSNSGTRRCSRTSSAVTTTILNAPRTVQERMGFCSRWMSMPWKRNERSENSGYPGTRVANAHSSRDGSSSASEDDSSASEEESRASGDDEGTSESGDDGSNVEEEGSADEEEAEVEAGM